MTDNEITALQARLNDARRARDRAEGMRDSAQAAVDRAQGELATDFGCTSVEQAEKMLKSMKDELDAMTADINEQLDRIGL